MKDLKYILRSLGISLVVVSLSFIIDLSYYYETDFVNGARRLFTGDIYSLTYYGMLVLFVIVLWELWQVINEALETKQRLIPFWLSFIGVIAVSFSPIFSLFKWMITFFLIAIMLHLAYQQNKLRKLNKNKDELWY